MVAPPPGVWVMLTPAPCTVAIWRTSVRPTPLPCRLVVKKGTKIFPALIGRNAGAIVGHCDHHMAARFQRSAERDLARLSVAQGFHGVAQQIDQRLIQ